MATSTTTTWTSQILSEAIASRAVPANLPKSVVLGLVNQDSIDGMPTKTKQYSVLTDLGAASAATEGTDIAATQTMTMGTAVTASPTEAAAVVAEVTNQAIRRRIPGIGSNAVQSLLQSAQPGPIVDALEDQASRLAAMCLETAEKACVDLVAGFSNTVGTSGSDVTVSNLIEAIYTAKTLETPHEDLVFCLAPNQVREIQLELASTSNASSSIWFQQADASMSNANLGGENGFRGSFLGVPVFEFAHSLRPSVNAGADTAGALMLRGRGSFDSGQVGALAFVEGAPLYFSADFNLEGRSIKLGCVYEFAATELSDNFGVSIITDAP